jgi:hypothetical protein
MSPAMVAAAAITGAVTDVRELLAGGGSARAQQAEQGRDVR